MDISSDVSSPSLGPPARPSEGIFARLEPAQSPKTWGSHITNKNSYNFRFLYVHKYPPARPSEANFALPEPARSPKSQKKPGSSPPEAQKLEARTSLFWPPSHYHISYEHEKIAADHAKHYPLIRTIIS